MGLLQTVKRMISNKRSIALLFSCHWRQKSEEKFIFAAERKREREQNFELLLSSMFDNIFQKISAINECWTISCKKFPEFMNIGQYLAIFYWINKCWTISCQNVAVLSIGWFFCINGMLWHQCVICDLISVDIDLIAWKLFLSQMLRVITM